MCGAVLFTKEFLLPFIRDLVCESIDTSFSLTATFLVPVVLFFNTTIV